MNFLPIFKYRLKDDLKAVGVFLLVTLLCMVLVIYGIMIMVSEIDDRVVSNFSIALTVFSFVIGIVTVREDLRLGIQNGVSRGTSLAACFTANVVASAGGGAGRDARRMAVGDDAEHDERGTRELLRHDLRRGREPRRTAAELPAEFCVERLGGVRGQFPVALVLAALKALALDSVARHGRGADFAAERDDDSRQPWTGCWRSSAGWARRR